MFDHILIKQFTKKHKLYNIKCETDLEKQIKYILSNVSIHKLNSRGSVNDLVKSKIVTIIKEKTSFLCDTASLRQRSWHILNDVYHILKCKQCDNNVLFSESRMRYNFFCSISCSKNNPEEKAKRAETLLSRYGVDNPAKVKEFIEKAQETSLNRYGVKQAAKLDFVKDKAKKTNMIRYGAPTKKQTHLLAQIDNYQNPSWLIEQNTNLKKSIIEISNDIGVSPTAIGSNFKKHNIVVKQYYQSIAERELCDYISKFLPIETKVKNIIYPYELDIFIPNKNIAIEYNGLYWHSDANQRTDKWYHKMKYDLCKDKGIRLITIFENEWADNKYLIENKLLSILNLSNDERVFARKTNIITVSSETKGKFFNTHHIQGNGPSSINYGAYINDKLVAVMGFIKHQDYFIINRYATACNVIGGFTKLLKHFERKYNFPKIITFADLRWSEGRLYLDNGFVIDCVLDPDYYWIRGKKLWHKFNWRHGSGLSKLKNYDPLLSESENMHNHGYNKIYDCGKIRFVKNGG